MSKGCDLPVTMSAAKRTFATQKARALWALERGRKQDESDPVNPGMIYSLMRQRHGLWEEVST